MDEVDSGVGKAPPTERTTNEGHAWGVLAVVWLAGACAPANMAKVTTLAPLLMDVFGISESGIGWVIAVFYILGVILAFPAAAICRKFGLKRTIIAALLFQIAGGLVGVLSTSLPVFMMSRVLEGAGMGIMGVCGVAAISPWFPNSKKGLPLSIWALWVSVPTIINPMVYSWLSELTGGWQASWWLMIVLCCIALVLFLVFYRTPNFHYAEDTEELVVGPALDESSSPSVTHGIRRAFREPAFWIVMLVTLVDGTGFMAYNGFITTYLTTEVGASLTQAALVVSIGAIIGAVASPVTGFVSDRVHSRRGPLLLSIILGAVTMYLAFWLRDYNSYFAFVVIQGLYCGIIATATWSIIGEAVPDDAVEGGTAGMAFFQNLGFFIGAVLFGYLVEAFGGWDLAMHVVIVPAYLVAALVIVIGWKKLP